MLKYVLALLVMLTMLVPARATPEVDPLSQVFVIRNSHGGMVGDYINLKSFIEKYKINIVFDGPCISACTLLIMLPKEQVCVTKNASFLFHRAIHPDAEVEQSATEAIYRSYPKWVRDFIDAKGGLTRELIVMNSTYAKRYLPSCKK